MNAAQAIRIRGEHAEQAYEALLSAVEEDLERLCAGHDYRQLLFVSRLCAGLPVFRQDELGIDVTHWRCQAADRWVLKRGARSLESDFMRIDESSFSIGEPPESLYLDAVKLHRLAPFHQRTVWELMRFNYFRLFSSENSLPGPAIIVAAAGGQRGIGLDCASAEAKLAAELFERRYALYNDVFSWWGFGQVAAEGKPLSLVLLIVRGVNAYPSAVADVVRSFRPRVTGHLQIQADGPGPSVEPPVRIRVEYGEDRDLDTLKTEIEQKIRQELIFQAAVALVPEGTLAPQGTMKTKLVAR